MAAWKIILIVIACIGAAIVARAILAMMLRAMVRSKGPIDAGDFRARVLRRYERHGMYELMFAWFKTRMDPMFTELPRFLDKGTRPGGAIHEISRMLDLGCGFGFAGSFLLEWFGEADIWAIDPSGARVAGAANALGNRGHAYQGAAPDFENPSLPAQVDIAFMLDVIHFLPDAALDLTLERVKARLRPGGMFIIRAPMLPDGAGSMSFNIDRVRRWITGSFAQFRTVEQVRARLTAGGFDVRESPMSGDRPELVWFICTNGAAAAT